VIDVGSDIAGFSPMMYMPRISLFLAACIDLDHGEAGFRVELHAHNFSKRAFASGVATR